MEFLYNLSSIEPYFIHGNWTMNEGVYNNYISEVTVFR